MKYIFKVEKRVKLMFKENSPPDEWLLYVSTDKAPRRSICTFDNEPNAREIKKIIDIFLMSVDIGFDILGRESRQADFEIIDSTVRH